MYVYIYECNHENNVTRLSPKWLCGNSYIWAHDVQLHIAGIPSRCSNQLSYQVMSLTCTQSQLCTAFRCSDQLSYQVMSLTCTQSQLCTTTLISSFI